jgi:hypothetical protein
VGSLKRGSDDTLFCSKGGITYTSSKTQSSNIESDEEYEKILLALKRHFHTETATIEKLKYLDATEEALQKSLIERI